MFTKEDIEQDNKTEDVYEPTCGGESCLVGYRKKGDDKDGYWQIVCGGEPQWHSNKLFKE
jgi:hypothetical protein